VVDYANLCQLLSSRNIVSCIVLTKTPQQRWLAFSCGVCFQSSLECFQWHATVLRCCWQSVIVVVYSKDWLCCVIEQWRDGITSGHPTGRWVITLHGRLHHSKHQQVPYTTTNTIFLRPLYMSACISQHLLLRTGGFCWCKVLLPACPCWRQPVHSD